MKLLTKELIRKLPKLYAQDEKGMDAIAYIKFFYVFSNWTWYATEGQPFKNDNGEDDFDFFGLVCGFEEELGYFILSELKSVTWHGLGIERDLHFKPTPLRKLMVAYELPESKAA